MIESLFYQRRLCRLLALLSVTTVVILVCLRPPGVVVAFVNPPTTTTAVPKISCWRQRWQQRQQQPYGKQVQLHFREGIDNDGNDNTETKSPRRPPASSSKQSTYVATATSSTLHDETDDSSGNPPIVSKSPPPPSRNNEKSTLRLMKARRLLEMAQITPSQRLETMQSSSSVARTRNTNDEYSFNTVVPMGSYSMRFGGFGSLEEELEQPPPPIMPQQTSSSTSRSQQQQQQSTNMYELRMADTFDSVDNLVDSQSSLLPPGGRWMTNENNGGGVSSSTNTPTIRASSQQQSRSSSIASSTSTTTPSSSYAAVAVAEPLVPYDPIAAEKQLFVQPTRWIVRNIQIAFPFGLWAAKIIIDTIFAVEKVNRKKRAKELNSIIGNLGPAIISKFVVYIMIAKSPKEDSYQPIVYLLSIRSYSLILHRGRTSIGIPSRLTPQ